MIKQFLTQPTRRQCDRITAAAFVLAALARILVISPIPALLLCIIGVLALIVRENAQ